MLLILMLGTFLLASLAFAVDLSGMWFHRQSAQSAADSACLAGAADMYVKASGSTPPSPGFTVGTASDCAATPAATMCTYARYNAYNGTGLSTTAESNSVSWTFPGTVAGTTAPSGVASPFLKVLVTENVKTFFMGLLGMNYQQVAASCTCGVVGVNSPAPLLVLNPTATDTLDLSSNGRITIVGGPQRSIQVNSSSLTAIQGGANNIVDLTLAGPAGTGGDVGVVGGPAIAPVWPYSTWNLGSTGNWVNPTLAIPDPYGAVPAPVKPADAALPTGKDIYGVPTLKHGTDGCPAPVGCIEYSPGYYSSTRPITVTNNDTAIFLPGIYYMDANVTFSANSTIRNASAGSALDGVMFYFKTGTLNLTGNSGAAGGDTLPSANLKCDPSDPAPPGVPTNLPGTILWSQCVTNGTYYDPLALTPTDSLSNTGTRGLLVFQAHTNTASPTLAANSQLLFSGAFYFHATNNSVKWTLSGNGGTGPSIVGYFVTDKLAISGNGILKMDLNGSPPTKVLKVAILQ